MDEAAESISRGTSGTGLRARSVVPGLAAVSALASLCACSPTLQVVDSDAGVVDTDPDAGHSPEPPGDAGARGMDAAVRGAGFDAAGSPSDHAAGPEPLGDDDDGGTPQSCLGSSYEVVTAEGGRTCTLLTVCTSGQYVVTEPTATSDRVCAACDAGHYSATDNAASCTPWRSCPGVPAIRGTAYSDALCECLQGAEAEIEGNVGVLYQKDLQLLAGVRRITGTLAIGFRDIGGEGMPWRWEAPDVPQTLAPLGCLESVGGLYFGVRSEELPSLAGLENLTSIEGDLEIEWLNTHDLEGLGGLASIGGSLVLVEAGMSLVGLDSLSEIGGSVLINVMVALTSLSGLEHVTHIGGNLDISWNEKLTSLTGLEGLSHVGGGVYIDWNHALVDLAGLQNLEAIDGGLYLGGAPDPDEAPVFAYNEGNDALVSLAGLERLQSLGGDLYVGHHIALSTTSGLDGLVSIGGDLFIEDNDALMSLRGLQNVQRVAGELQIHDNTSLAQCLVDEWVGAGVVYGSLVDVTTGNGGNDAACL